MIGATTASSHRLRPWLTAIVACTIGAVAVLAPRWRAAPTAIADVAEKVIDAVVNISTSQTIEAKGGRQRRDAAIAAGFAV